MKVKIFYNKSGNRHYLESEINDWLKAMECSNSFFEVLDRTLSTVLADDHQTNITVAIWYEDYNRGGSS